VTGAASQLAQRPVDDHHPNLEWNNLHPQHPDYQWGEPGAFPLTSRPVSEREHRRACFADCAHHLFAEYNGKNIMSFYRDLRPRCISAMARQMERLKIAQVHVLKQPTITQITQLYSLIYDYLYMTIASFKLRMTKRKK
jgi:hypothetical protein